MKPPMRQGSPDDFQTPAKAILPLLPYLGKSWRIWECACGNGNLANGLREKGFDVVATDIIGGYDFLTYQPENFDCIVTNPPFKYKQQFLERCYQIRKPFALLLPLTTLETRKRQRLLEKYGVEIILFDRRINFETPNKVKNSAAWFATAWFTNWLNIGSQLNYARLEVE
jgi:hypothetical protein